MVAVVVVAAETGAVPADAWTAVSLTEARQVEALIGGDPDRWSPAEVRVRDRYESLRRGRQLSAATEYLGHALPRLEAVSWAARIVTDAAAKREPMPRARHSLDTALRWLDDPTEEHRRAARIAADAVGKPVPEQFLGFAVFYSGGSVAPPGMQPSPPPPHSCARFAVSAVQQLAYASPDFASVFDTALDLGELIAKHGLQVLARR